MVHAIDLGRVHGHAPVFPVRISRFIPGGCVLVAGRYVPVGADDFHVFEHFVAGGARRVPAAFAVLALVAGDVLLKGVERPVRCRVRDVHEEGLIGACGDEVNGVVGDGVGEVEVGGILSDRGAVEGAGASAKVAAVGPEAKEAVEAVLHFGGDVGAVRSFAAVPLARH